MYKLKLHSKPPVILQDIVCVLEGFKLNKERIGKHFVSLLKKSSNGVNGRYEELFTCRHFHLRGIIEHTFATVIDTKLLHKMEEGGRS